MRFVWFLTLVPLFYLLYTCTWRIFQYKLDTVNYKWSSLTFLVTLSLASLTLLVFTGKGHARCLAAILISSADKTVQVSTLTFPPSPQILAGEFCFTGRKFVSLRTLFLSLSPSFPSVPFPVPLFNFRPRQTIPTLTTGWLLERKYQSPRNIVTDVPLNKKSNYVSKAEKLNLLVEKVEQKTAGKYIIEMRSHIPWKKKKKKIY